MKNFALTLFVMVLSVCFSVSSAQRSIGLKGGVSIAHLTGFEDVMGSGTSRLTGHGGIFVNQTINTNWRLQPELLWSGQGQKYLDNAIERSIALDYLQIPVMIQYYPVSRLYFEAGPALGILLNAKDKGNSSTSHRDMKDNFTAAELAVAVGLGVKATDDVSLYGRYNFGLNDATRLDVNDFHNQFAQIGIAISLH